LIIRCDLVFTIEINVSGVYTYNKVAGENTIAVRLSEALLCPGALAPGIKGGSARNVWHS